MCARGQDLVGPLSWGVAQESVGDLADGHRLNYSWNDGGAGAEKVVQALACSAFDFALVYDAPQLPSRRSSSSGLWGGTREHQYCEQIEDITIP